MKLFDRLKLARTFSGSSQAELAEKLEVHPSVVTRYEGSREPGQWVLEKIAQATGIPSYWIKTGTEFQGIVTGRIELPGSDYSVKTLRSIESNLAKIFPVFLSENPPERVVVLKAKANNATPTAFILGNNDYCLILFSNKTTQMLLNLISNHNKFIKMDINVNDIDLETYLNAYIQPQMQYLKKLVLSAGYGNSDWMKDFIFRNGHIIKQKDYCSTYSFSCLTPQNTSDSQENMWMNFISEYLKSVGCTEITWNKIRKGLKPLPIPKFAPKDFNFDILDFDRDEVVPEWA